MAVQFELRRSVRSPLRLLVRSMMALACMGGLVVQGPAESPPTNEPAPTDESRIAPTDDSDVAPTSHSGNAPTDGRTVVPNAAAQSAAPMKFDSARAYEHLRRQVGFGPRPAGSAALAQT